MSERLNDGFDDLFTMPIVSEDDTLSDPLNKEKEERKKKTHLMMVLMIYFQILLTSL